MAVEQLGLAMMFFFLNPAIASAFTSGTISGRWQSSRVLLTPECGGITLPGASSENIARAIRFLDAQNGSGGTELLPALRTLCADPRRIAEHYLGRYHVWESSGSPGQPGLVVQDDC